MAPNPDWNFIGDLVSKPSLEDEEVDDALEEMRGIDADSLVDQERLRLAFKLAKTVMTVSRLVGKKGQDGGEKST